MIRVLILVSALVSLPSCGESGSTEKLNDTAGQTSVPPVVRSWALPESAFNVSWSTSLPISMPVGATVPINVVFKNAGPVVWPDPLTAEPVRKDGAYAVRLSYRWLSEEEGQLTGYDRVRVDLPHSLGPGQTLTLPVLVKVPIKAGKYKLQFDLVQELVAWFESKGADVLMGTVEVK